MEEYVFFVVNQIACLSDMLDEFSFNISGMNVSIFELFIGFVALSIVISVFWKGARG